MKNRDNLAIAEVNTDDLFRSAMYVYDLLGTMRYSEIDTIGQQVLRQRPNTDQPTERRTQPVIEVLWAFGAPKKGMRKAKQNCF